MIEIDALFFDVDGTLVDSKEDIVIAVNYALNRLNIPLPPAKEIVSYIGTGVKDLIRKSLGPPNIGFADEGVKLFSEYYTKHSADKSKLYPHVREILEYFKDKRKFILTNRFKEFAEKTLEAFGIKGYFKEMLGGDNENCMKPSACVLDNVFPRFKIDRNKAMIVGDMAIDVQAGKNSGIKTCWVTYGLGKREDLKGLKPDYTIDDLMGLKDIII